MQKILVCGGGTGGHIYPAIAFCHFFQARGNSKIEYVGVNRRLDKAIIKKNGSCFDEKHFISMQGLYRGKNPLKLIFHNLLTLILLVWSFIKSFFIVLKFNPDLVIATGGYITGSIIIVSKILNKKIILHEQNSYPGKANIWGSKFADATAISFENSKKYFHNLTMYTSNPRVDELVKIKTTELKSNYKLSESKKTIIFVGGSLGAKPINDIAIQSIEKLHQNNYNVIFITGERYYQEAKNQVSLDTGIQIMPYAKNLDQLIKMSDIVVSRAGATTIFETLALKRPLILIPSPNVTADHQNKNADEFIKLGVALKIEEKDLNIDTLMNAINYFAKNNVENKINELPIFNFQENFKKLLQKIGYDN